jgi:phage shock protein PspC (stress-responsive transcriptional regulator)
MKKVEKVSIAEISFTLDNDAYIALKQYLDSLDHYYGKDPDGSEIIRDIEARIAELILDEQVYTKVVSKPLIDTIIAQLGTPEEIDSEASEEGEDEEFSQSAGTTGAATGSTSETPIPRRLHRSAEVKMLGGVCGGIARYMDINVAWVRVVFLLPLLLRILNAPFDRYSLEEFFEGWIGVFFLTYIILWIALPMAVTPRQKLEARGQKITSASIRQNMQSSVHTPSGQKAASVTAELVSVLGRVVIFCVKFIMAMVGFFSLFAAIGVLTGMIVLPFSPLFNFHVDGTGIFSPFDGMAILSPVMYMELMFLCLMLPFFVIGMALLSFAFSWRLGRMFYGITLGTWVLAVIFAGVVGASNARFFHKEFRNIIEYFEDRFDSNWGWHIEKDYNWLDNDGWYIKYEVKNATDVLRGKEVDVIDLEGDSLGIVIKRGGINDTIKVASGDQDTEVSAPASNSLSTDEAKPEVNGKKRIEIRRIE